jgi:hypothetical protein
MNKLFGEFRTIFKDLGPNEDVINMYLVFMGVRSACLIKNINIFYLMPEKAGLVIYFGRYPGHAKHKFDYPLVCLKDSLVSKSIQSHNKEFTEYEVGLYLGFNCFNQDWSNLRINRYGIKYILDGLAFYNEVCSVQPDLGMLARIKFKAKEITAALKLIDPKYSVKYSIEFLPKIPIKQKQQIM